jgi:hypothetical protein
MKNVVIAAVLALALSGAAYAWTGNIVACTQDKKTVTLAVEIDDKVAGTHPVLTHVATAFTKAAASMPAADLVGVPGYQAFLAGLDEQDEDAVSFTSAPTIKEGCK